MPRCLGMRSPKWSANVTFFESEGWSTLQTIEWKLVSEKDSPRGYQVLAAAILAKREREIEGDLINAIFRVVDSVARFLYKIYNCELQTPNGP